MNFDFIFFGIQGAQRMNPNDSGLCPFEHVRTGMSAHSSKDSDACAQPFHVFV